MSVEFEWDAQKARSNLRKHGVDFADCVSVFFDDLAITIKDDSSDEERYLARRTHPDHLSSKGDST